MGKKMSNAMVQHCKHAIAMRRVLEITGMTEEQYCWYKYQCGLEYLLLILRHAFEGERVTRDMITGSYDYQVMERSAAFWGWWKVNWFNRDADFIEVSWEFEPHEVRTHDGKVRTTGPWNKRMVQEVYQRYHNPYQLAQAITPNGAVLEASYARDLVPVLNAGRAAHE